MNLILILSLVLYLAAILFLIGRYYYCKNKKIILIKNTPLANFFEPILNKIVFYLTTSLKSFFNSALLFSLLLIRHLLSLIKYLIIKIENIFSQIIEKIKGRKKQINIWPS